MKAQLEQIRRAAKEALASFDSAEQLEKARIQYLGKKGELTAILKQMGKLSAEERPVIGQLANEIRKDIEDTIANKSAEIKKAAQEKRLAEETLDVTMPGTLPQIGYKHPLSIVLALVVVVLVYFLEIWIDNNFARVKWQALLASAWGVALVAGGVNIAFLAYL